jgi:membrane protein implicated in regulation of membrane protease activity
MAHWPKTVSGNLFIFVLAVGAAPILVWLAVSLSGPMVWASLTVVALTCVALYVWRRRIEADKERAWVGAFSFGDEIRRMRAREAHRSDALEGVVV